MSLWRDLETPIWSISGQENMEPISQIPFFYVSSFYLTSSSVSLSLKNFLPSVFTTMPAEKWLVVAHPTLFSMKALWNKGHGVNTLSVFRQMTQFYYFITSKKLWPIYVMDCLRSCQSWIVWIFFNTHIKKENHNLLFWITKLYLELQIEISDFYLIF